MLHNTTTLQGNRSSFTLGGLTSHQVLVLRGIFMQNMLASQPAKAFWISFLLLDLFELDMFLLNLFLVLQAALAQCLLVSDLWLCCICSLDQYFSNPVLRSHGLPQKIFTALMIILRLLYRTLDIYQRPKSIWEDLHSLQSYQYSLCYLLSATWILPETQYYKHLITNKLCYEAAGHQIAVLVLLFFNGYWSCI